MKVKKMLIFCIIAAVLLTAGCNNTNGITENEAEIFGIFTKEELVADADRLMTVIKAYSAKLYTDEDELNEAYEKAVAGIKDSMTGLEFIRLMSPVVASIRCGHTHLMTGRDNNWWEEVDLLPMDIKIIDKRFYLTNNEVVSQIPEGSEILEINGNTSSEILNAMLPAISADGYNETVKYYYLNRFFVREYMFKVEYTDTFDIKYKDPAGNEFETTVSSMKINNVLRKLAPPEPPIYESQFEEDYAILTVSNFNPFGKYTITAFNQYFDEFFLELKDKGIETLILDVRGNGGGDPMITSHLFSYLEKVPQPYWSPEAPNYYSGLKDDISKAENHFAGDLYILIDGGCFSSTGHLLALLKYQGVGTFIGEESGGSFVCTDSSKDQSLPNTDLNFHYSTQAWAVAVEGLEPGRGIMPDHEVTNTLEDYLNKTDPVISFALNLIGN